MGGAEQLMDNIPYYCVAFAAVCGLIGNTLARKARKSEKKWQLVTAAVLAAICILAVGIGFYFAIKSRMQ